MSKKIGWYLRSYEVEIVDSKPSKPSIKDLFKDLSDEIKGFKYQITLKVSLLKHKGNGDIEYVPLYFNSITKTVIHFK